MKKLPSFSEWRKDREIYKGQKENPQGYISGNPRFGKTPNKLAGKPDQNRSKIKDKDRKDNFDQEQYE